MKKLDRLATWGIALVLAFVSCHILYLTVTIAIPHHYVFGALAGLFYSATMAMGAYLVAGVARKG